VNGEIPATYSSEDAANARRRVWTRPEAIDRLRAALIPMCEPDRSMCEVAAQKGIFCRGFRRWHDAEFHRRWKPALGTSTHLDRAQMEQLADLWQLSEQVRCSVAFACDASVLHPGACRGWNEFSNESLARFCADLLGFSVVVIDGDDAHSPDPYLGARSR